MKYVIKTAVLVKSTAAVLSHYCKRVFSIPFILCQNVQVSCKMYTLKILKIRPPNIVDVSVQKWNNLVINCSYASTDSDGMANSIGPDQTCLGLQYFI